MECKQCGAKLEEDVLFCGKCGTKVESVSQQVLEDTSKPPPKFCRKCGDELKEGAQFCRKCGEPIKVKTSKDSGQEEALATLEETGQTGPLRKPKSKKMKHLLVGAVAVVAAGILIVTIGAKTPGVKKDIDLVLFQEDQEDIYAKASGKEKYILKASSPSHVVTSQDGKVMYSIDEENTLYMENGKKGPEKISGDVNWASVSPSGNTLAYVKSDQSNSETGELYVRSGKSEPERVASEGCLIETVRTSQNGKYIIYTEIADDFDEESIRSYLYPVGGEKISIGKHVALGVDDKGTVLSKNLNENLYRTKKGKPSEKLASDVGRIVANRDFSKLMILELGGDLYSYKGSKKEKLERNVSSLLAKGLVDGNGSNFFHTGTKELDISFFRNNNMYVKLDGKEAEKIGASSDQYPSISDDYRTFAYIKNEGLYVKRFKNNKLKEEEKIDSNVTMISMNASGSDIAYIKEDDLYYLPKGKKEGVRINTNDDVTNIMVAENGNIYYETYEEDLFLTKATKAGDKIAGDVYEWTVNNGVAYVIDYDDDLYEIIANKKPERIAHDASSVWKTGYGKFRIY